MSLLEQAERVLDRGIYYQYVLGIRKEFPELNPVAATLLIAKSRAHVIKHKSRIEGYPLPKRGAAIFAGNHQYQGDNYKICIAGVDQADRLTRAVVKKSLVVEGFSETDEYLQSIEAKIDSFEYRPLMAFVLKGVGSISVDRENPDRSFLEVTDAVIKSDQMLGVFIQPHRYEDCFLRYLQVGAATVARRHPDTPVYPCAFSGPPYVEDRLTILEPFTYNQKVKELNRRISVGEFTILVADAITSAQPYIIRADWKTRRAVELARLTKLASSAS